MAASKQASKQAYTHFCKCNHASVGLTQACPNYSELSKESKKCFLTLQAYIFKTKHDTKNINTFS